MYRNDKISDEPGFSRSFSNHCMLYCVITEINLVDSRLYSICNKKCVSDSFFQYQTDHRRFSLPMINIKETTSKNQVQTQNNAVADKEAKAVNFKKLLESINFSADERFKCQLSLFVIMKCQVAIRGHLKC